MPEFEAAHGVIAADERNGAAAAFDDLDGAGEPDPPGGLSRGPA